MVNVSQVTPRPLLRLRRRPLGPRSVATIGNAFVGGLTSDEGRRSLCEGFGGQDADQEVFADETVDGIGIIEVPAAG